MKNKTRVSIWIAWVVGMTAGAASAAEWWNDFPRMVDARSPSAVTDYHGGFAFSMYGTDPAWGTFYQAHGIDLNANNFTAFENAGMKHVCYTETYGQTIAHVTEPGAWNGSDLTPVLHHYWNWQEYSGGTIRWVGAKDFFDNEDYARPYTRTHSRYGGAPMRYPDGSEATGYDGDAFDPRNSRVYDASCAKGITGNLHIDYGFPAAGATNDGLFYIAADNDYAGHMSFGKDSACPLWTLDRRLAKAALESGVGFSDS